MKMQTKFSTKGQVVDVIETAGGVLLKTPAESKAASVEVALSRVRAAINYDGPPLGEGDWKAGSADAIQSK